MSENSIAVVDGFQTSAGFELIQRVGKMFSGSAIVPKNYQGNLPNCVIAIAMAARLKADPLMVMCNLDIIHGRPSWRAQFLIACFNGCGRFSAIKYRFSGVEHQDNWACTAYATELSTGDVIEGPTISIDTAKKEGWYNKDGSKWKTIPGLMLRYRAAAWLVRTSAPELAMGMHTTEELADGADGGLPKQSLAKKLAEVVQESAQSAQESAQESPPKSSIPVEGEVTHEMAMVELLDLLKEYCGDDTKLIGQAIKEGFGPTIRSTEQVGRLTLEQVMDGTEKAKVYLDSLPTA